MDLPRLLLMGRPNVGKSTLFNRMVGRRNALTHHVKGTTRDCRQEIIHRHDLLFNLVDSGGLMERGSGELDPLAQYDAAINALVWKEVEQANLIWLIVSARDGIHPHEMTLANQLRKRGADFWVIVNKVDHPTQQPHAGEFYEMAAKQLMTVSALHGHGLVSLQQALPKSFHQSEAAIEDTSTESDLSDPTCSVMMIGRPNAGKSSLVNALLGEERMLVSATSGTTREAVTHLFNSEGKSYQLIDSAGLRRKSKVPDGAEKLGALHSLDALSKTDVGVLVVDPIESIVEQDQRIAAQVLKYRRAVVVAVTKQDLWPRGKAQQQQYIEAAHDVLHFLDFADFVPISAKHGTGLKALMRAVRAATVQFNRWIPTSEVNRVLKEMLVHRPPPAKGQSMTRILYGTQIRNAPPLFRFFTNHPEQISATYTRFVEHQLRRYFGLQGSPIGIQWQARNKNSRNAS